ncbi:CRELD2 family protein [Megaselia abdita]
MLLLKIPILLLLFGFSSAQLEIPSPEKSKEKSTNLPPCKSCSVFVESFKKGMKDTERGKHDGGDAAWEEKKLGSYKTSEVRLTEIQENLCKEVKRGEDQCHTLANEHEELVEEWWFKNQDSSDLHTWLCIDKLTVCCPDGHFGPNCDTCSDCNGNGRCKGNGTRKGNGKCSCDDGYSGEFCNSCSIQYYESFRDETKMLCSPCHPACGGDGGCTGSGPKGCRKCKEGWRMNPEYGCFDINECVEDSRICKQKQFCVNKEGSYSCLDCDRSCESCDGDGPDMCKKCSPGYELREGKCTDLTEGSGDLEASGWTDDGSGAEAELDHQSTIKEEL